MLSLAVCH
jgi:hypothetical protein